MDPTNCNRCNSILEYGWSERYNVDNLIESICFDCDHKERVKEYEDNDILTLKMTMCATMDEIHQEYGEPTKLSKENLSKILGSYRRIEHEINLWEKEVWFNGLQEEVKRAKFRGWKLNFVDGYVLVYSMAGRTQFTIESKGHKSQISLLTAEDSETSVMGLNSINATEEQAIKLLIDSRIAFTTGTPFLKDDDVNLGF